VNAAEHDAMTGGTAAGARRTPVSLRLVTGDDEEALARTLATYPWEGISARPWSDRIRHWWTNNPAFTPGWDRGWLLEAGDGPDAGIVGFFGSVPRRVNLDGQSRLSANATAWWVAPAHRKASLQLLARFTAQSACGHFNTTAAPGTHEAMRAFGYQLLQSGDDNRESLMLIDPGRVLSVKVTARLAAGTLPGGRIGRGLGRWTAGLAQALASAGAVVQRARLPRAGGPHDWEQLTRADDRFSALADTVRKRHRFTAERDPLSINWFLEGDFAERKILLACRRGARLAGFAVFWQRDSDSLAGLPVLDCIDLVREADDAGIMAALCRGIAEIARQRDVPIVVIRHYDRFTARCCRDFRLAGRPGRERREFVKLPPAALGPADCHLTQFHGDFII
jgi:hypothetical protein